MNEKDEHLPTVPRRGSNLLILLETKGGGVLEASTIP